MNIKNIMNSCFCDCTLKGMCYFSVITNFDCNLQIKQPERYDPLGSYMNGCSLSSNFEEEEITKSSLKIEEFVEV